MNSINNNTLKKKNKYIVKDSNYRIVSTDLKLKNIVSFLESMNRINVYDFEYIDRQVKSHSEVMTSELNIKFEEFVDENVSYLNDYSKLINFKKIK